MEATKEVRAAVLWAQFGYTFKPGENWGDAKSAARGVAYLRAFSMAPVTSADSGVIAGSKRAITLPLRSTRNFVKLLYFWNTTES
jgi:hypothetical protein